jgi:hypothetical protein
MAQSVGSEFKPQYHKKKKKKKETFSFLGLAEWVEYLSSK